MNDFMNNSNYSFLFFEEKVKIKFGVEYLIGDVFMKLLP